MPEEQNNVKPVEISYICDECGEGEMLPYGKSNMLADPPIVAHKCTKCAALREFTEKYPRIVFNKISLDSK